MRAMPLLELTGVEKRWPGMTVSLDLTLDEGELLAVTGPSGCGKSTALRLVAGLATPDAGEMLLDGRSLAGVQPRDRGVGMVFQDHALFPHLNVLGNVCYGLVGRGLVGRGLDRRAREGRARELLAAMGLEGFGRRMPAELSGGERQRVALARTLAVEPRIVLFDEPLSSLDAALRKRLRAELRESQRRLGFSAIYVTHDLEEALAIADRVAVMESGRFLQCAPPAELWTAPAFAAVARFLGSGPCLPLTGLAAADGTMIASTAEGSFPVGRGSDPDGCVFFGRAEAVPRSGTGPVPAGFGRFTARCLRADFVGDAMDCAMESGGERFSLRFPRDGAPAEGASGEFLVPADRVRILPADPPARIR